MNVGVKYCGGCNSKYDRKQFLYSLERDFKRKFEVVDSSKTYDIIIVLCGCTSCCADHLDLKFNYEKILVTCKDDYYMVKRILNKYLI
ncbi:hypothetical protein D4Z93_11480 [Clostridium fermenticellae]|uniref:Uncharacterized protein n=1 Tax=Clostridium fermenticellae TaxID=2068654 RepID=A0A386H622_9CLOT|nr:hypothetical protein [Clostridium fermenticellae]AYD41106.1 hypothetical protein D4Z93_11480 [Clostridium fermenticellae]